MKRIRLFGCIILSTLLAVGCKSQGESSAKVKKVTRKTSVESEATSSEEPTESIESTESTESKKPTKPSETTRNAKLESISDAAYDLMPPSDIARGLLEQLVEWDMPCSWGFYDESLEEDCVIDCEAQPDSGVMFEVSYIYFAVPENAEKRFEYAVENGEVYGQVEKKSQKDDGYPRICVWIGSFQYDESSPVMPDCYVFIQFEREYLYVYGRGEVEVQRVYKLMEKLEIELPT